MAEMTEEKAKELGLKALEMGWPACIGMLEPALAIVKEIEGEE